MASYSNNENIMVSGQTAYFKKNGTMTNHGTLNLPNANIARTYNEGYIAENSILHGTDLADTTDYIETETSMHLLLDEDWEEKPNERTIITNANNISTALSLYATDIKNIADTVVRYIPVEYIQSSGTQWIDTLVTGKGHTKIDVKFDSSNYNASSEHCVLGSRIYSETSMFILGFYSRGWYGYRSSQGSPMQLIGGIYEVRLDKGKFYWFNTATGNWDLKNTYAAGTFTTPSNMILFGERRSNTIAQLSSIKLYYCKIYEDDTLVRDYIPIKDLNNVACLYDKVSDTYFYNQGSGTFIAGPEIN